MIYSLKGILTYIELNFIVIECGGMGYKCFTTSLTQKSLSNRVETEIFIYTHMSVREGDISLYAFPEKDELNCFRMLISVSGVGAKAALAILSEFSPEQVAMFVSSNDSKSITKAAGVGNKLAQRIVLELRDKFKMPVDGFQKSGSTVISASINVDEAIKALSVLGYSQAEVVSVISKFDSSLKVEELIRLTLKSMR